MCRPGSGLACHFRLHQRLLVEVRVMEWLVPLVGMIMVGLIAQAHALEVQLALYRAERVGAPAQCFPSG